MGMLEMALKMAGSQSEKIAKVIGKRPEEVKGAIQQASRMLPEIMSSKDGGIGVLNRLGVDKSFISDMTKRYGKYANKIGLSSDAVQNAVNSIENAVDSKPAPTQATRKSAAFDSSKYPKI